MGKSNQILCIQNVLFETLGNLKDFLLSDGYDVSEILAMNQPLPENIRDFDAIIILGGPMSVYDNYSYLLKEKELIKKSLFYEIPILGICLGSQLISSACGGNIYPGIQKEIGWYKVNLTAKGKTSLFSCIDENEIEVFHWHGDTFTLPHGAEVLSYSDYYIQSFNYKTAYGVQFHLEITSNMIHRWISEYKSELYVQKIKKEDLISDIEKKVTRLRELSNLVYKNFMSKI